MRFLYLDSGLVNELGHHANFCRAITQEFRNKGIPTIVFAHEKVTQRLHDNLKARPHFRVYSYDINDNDRVIAWLNSFETGSRTTLEDLQRIHGLEPTDIVYMNWAWPTPLMALIQWANGIPPSRLPTIIAEVGADPGLEPMDLELRPIRLMPRDPRADSRAILYRYAARQISPGSARRLHLVTFDRVTSSAFQALLDFPVTTLPMPYAASTSRRSRAGANPITISVLGHQRPEKGFELMPEIATTLLREHAQIRILAHNAKPTQMSAAQKAMRQLAASNGRLMLEEAVAGPALWASLLERSDLVVCPYHPAVYAFSHSSVACESLANAIPLVVPARTALASQLEDFGSAGATFEAFTAQSVTAAITRVLNDFDRYAEVAYEAAAQWAKTMGPERVLEGLLALAGAGPP
ncbi:MAG TPA: glycosyltransferase family 1 protein [Stellaceae bacterium]|nr:glycosyltransferase family 1 protein [Stellaceae bacterium]